MSDVPIKSFVLEGSLNLETFLDYQFANNETRNGLWHMCVRDIAYTAVEELNLIVRLSTNLVKDFRLKNNRRETYNPAIATFLLKAKPTKKKIFQLEPIWFEINCANSELKLYFTNAETNIVCSNNCKVFVTILMQQIK